MSACDGCGSAELAVWTGNTALCMLCFELAVGVTSEEVDEVIASVACETCDSCEICDGPCTHCSIHRYVDPDPAATAAVLADSQRRFKDEYGSLDNMLRVLSQRLGEIAGTGSGRES